ncbi:MAG: BamA/TamA family outer membrane protein [Cyclonatronaceae bacterium]
MTIAELLPGYLSPGAVHYTRLLALLFIFSLVFQAQDARAQGFSMVNDRNHPELRWMQAETRNFLIMYPEHLAGIESEAAAIAEETYRVLSENLNVTFQHKIRIYLTDEDEIVNGFAVPIGGFFTNIWVNQNEVAETWTGQAKWLRKVIAHELVHIFHYQAVKGTFWPLDYILSESMPSFWAEGLAQYQTEKWDAFRGDSWLRTAIYDNNLDYRSGQSLWDGTLMYATGNSQLRFFAEQYGDSTLASLLAHRKPVLFGLGKTHNFYTAFESVTGDSYAAFDDRWRRHMTIYYNTMAGQMERLDSLASDPLTLPASTASGFQYDAAGRYIALVGLTSVVQPVRRLWLIDTENGSERILDDGPVGSHLSWHPDGETIAYHRITRGRYGSLQNELYKVNIFTGRREQLTRNRRASYPEWMPDGRIAFIGSEAGTGNIFVLDIASGSEVQLTAFEGDVQLAGLRRQPGSDRLAFSRFDEQGYREIVILDPATETWHAIGDPDSDSRMPVWSPDGSLLAYTSLRDQVPNVFVTDPSDDYPGERVTRQFTGASAHSWLPPDTLLPGGRLVIATTDTKTRNYIYEIDADSRAVETEIVINPSYTGWTKHHPPAEIPKHISPDPSLITSNRPYCSWCSIDNVITIPIPFYASGNDWGPAVISVFSEPLGKHMFIGGLGVSVNDPLDGGFALISYINRQLAPTLTLNIYHRSYNARFYGDDLLFNRYSGGDAGFRLPLDLFNISYTQTAIGAQVSYAATEPTRELTLIPAGLSPAEKAREAGIRLWFSITQKRPYRFLALHPLDGFGIRFQVRGAGRFFGGDSRFIRPDLRAYRIFSGPANHRIYIYGRAVAQKGRSLNQDFFGLTRYGDLSLLLPGLNQDILYGDGERVRGYSDYVIGNRLLFTSLEYRMPLVSNLQTQILGFAAFGGVILAPFMDAGMVWTGALDYGKAVKRAGAGVELKNLMSVGGLQFKHAVGFAQPIKELSGRDYELYYRIKVAVPF